MGPDLYLGAGSGASGGLGDGLMALGATARDRFDVLLGDLPSATDLDELVARAVAMAADHAPPTAKFLDWFLRRTSLDMMAPDADDRLLAAMKKGGWPV